MAKSITYVGLDVHKDTIAVALAEMGLRGEVRAHGKIPNTPAALNTLAVKLASAGIELRFCYEAGPCGYGIQRQLAGMGHDCAVVAPSLIPRKPGERIKTDRRDAGNLAKLHRAGELTPVWVPDQAHEAIRDLVRARQAAVRTLRQARQQLSGFLLLTLRIRPLVWLVTLPPALRPTPSVELATMVPLFTTVAGSVMALTPVENPVNRARVGVGDATACLQIDPLLPGDITAVRNAAATALHVDGIGVKAGGEDAALVADAAACFNENASAKGPRRLDGAEVVVVPEIVAAFVSVLADVPAISTAAPAVRLLELGAFAVAWIRPVGALLSEAPSTSVTAGRSCPRWCRNW